MKQRLYKCSVVSWDRFVALRTAIFWCILFALAPTGLLAQTAAIHRRVLDGRTEKNLAGMNLAFVDYHTDRDESTQSKGQTSPLAGVTHSASFKFAERDGTCVYGNVSKTDATSITVQPFEKPPVILQKANLLQVSQGNDLLYSARSSWTDVSEAILYPHEAFVATLKSGKQVKGKPIKTSPDSITLKHGLGVNMYTKSEILSIDYLRIKPATDAFIAVLGEAPWMLVFDPEFYYRATGLPGKLTIRLYDATKPEDDSPVVCKSFL